MGVSVPTVVLGDPGVSTVRGLTCSHGRPDPVYLPVLGLGTPVRKVGREIFKGPRPVTVPNGVNGRGHLDVRAGLATLSPVLPDA